jgi:FAD/FMN-containing dehydrogenase
MKLLRALAIALYARHAHASTVAALRACEELSLSLLDRVQMQWSREYNEEVLSYWSTALQEVRPACIVFPISANDVATAIKMLNKHKDVRFAVKSGGHSPTPNHSSVENGVLITTSAMVGAKYDKQRQLAYVKPGGKWNDVIPMLEKDGISMLGGRIGLLTSISPVKYMD